MADGLAPPLQGSSRRVFVRPATTKDIDFMVANHDQSSAAGDHISLGRRQLRRYYRTFIYNPACWTRVAYCDERPAGFLVGVLRPDQRYARVSLLRRVTLLPLVVRAALLNPRLALGCAGRRITAIAQVRRTPKCQRSARLEVRTRVGVPPAVLSHLAVESMYQRLGIGACLVGTSETAATDRGTTTAVAATASNDLCTEAFFRHLGWSTALCSEAPQGRSVLWFSRDLSQAAPASGRSRGFTTSRWAPGS